MLFFPSKISAFSYTALTFSFFLLFLFKLFYHCFHITGESKDKYTMAPTVEKIIENLQFTEGPHWDEDTQSLYFVEMFSKSIHRYVPSTKKHTKALLGTDHVSLIIPVRGQKNKFIVGLRSELAVVTWDGESEKPTEIKIIYENTNDDSTQFNDGKCDPSGRLWLGSMFRTDRDLSAGLPEGLGSFYSFQGNKLKTFLTKVGISNGLAFDAQLKKLYYIDSMTNCVDQFDFDLENGNIENRKPIFSFAKNNLEGGPDGMTIDTDGNLWVAGMTSSLVLKIDPRKPETVLETIQLPTNLVTSVAFGGKNLDELYVTSGRPWTVEPTPDDGCIYRITGVNAKGLPGVSVVL